MLKAQYIALAIAIVFYHHKKMKNINNHTFTTNAIQDYTSIAY